MSKADDRWVDPVLQSRVASELKEFLQQVSVGEEFTVDPSAGLASALERFLPQLLRGRYPVWKGESLDGVFAEFARKTGSHAARLGGACILITDQTLTPFLVDLEVSPEVDAIVAYRLRLGEPGGGRLGISGPECNSPAASGLRYSLKDRLEDVDWSFDVADREISESSS